LPRFAADRTLLAPVEDVWAFIAEPYHLADWWPGIAGVQPDRRGFAPGARWRVQGPDRPSLLKRPDAAGTLLVLDIVPGRRFEFQLTGQRLLASLELEDAAERHTRAILTIDAPWLAVRRSFPRHALGRLYDLVQTGAE
jgi:uncharacterized protein YndB with AHSA1/START domain